MRRFRPILIAIAFAAAALPAPAAAQENAVQVEFAADSARSTVIGAFKRNGFVYVSLNDIAHVFSLATYASPETQKFEVKRVPLRLKVSGGNPFVVVTDDSGKRTAYQLPAKVIYAANSYFVPLSAFLPLLRPVFGINASYNQWTGVLGVGVQPVASAYDIPGLRLESKTNGMLIRISATKKLDEYENWMRGDGWLYVTVGNARADTASINAVRPRGMVKQIIAIQSPTSVQLTFRLAGKVAATEITSDDSSDDLLLAIRTPVPDENVPPAVNEVTPPPQPAAPATVKHELPAGDLTARDSTRAGEASVIPAAKPETFPTGQIAEAAADTTHYGPDTTGTAPEAAPALKAPKREPAGRQPSVADVKPPHENPPARHEMPPGLADERAKWKLDVIVLDAGHGGYDPGSIGVTGVKEKTITLGIVLKLGALITKNLKDVKVVYTRKDDRFVELYKRGKIANEAGGKLFISVHCNSLPHKPNKTRGFEVYLLRPGRTDEAIAIAERENSVIEMEPGYEEKYPELTEENFILVTMAQSAYVKASEEFADLVQKEISSRTKIPNKGVKQAGFYVLVGASMPNVLVESAYLSNRDDERFLRSDSGQMKIADALFRAVKKYKAEYEKQLQEGKDFGEVRREGPEPHEFQATH